MLKSLFLLLKGLIGESFARVLSGAGLSMVSFAGITAVVTGALTLAVQYVNGISGAMLQIVLLLGTGHALSLIGAALLTRAAMTSAGIGFKKKAA